MNLHKKMLTASFFLGCLVFIFLVSAGQAAIHQTTWKWNCAAGKTYTWTVAGNSSDNLVRGTSASWTIEALKNGTEVGDNIGNLTGAITSDGFSKPAGTKLYELNFETQIYDLVNANYLRTGGFLPATNLSVTASPGAMPVYKQQMTLLNSTLYAWISTLVGWDPTYGTIDFVKGNWVLTYRNIPAANQLMMWTIAQTGLVVGFLETDASGRTLVSVSYDYPPLDPSIWAAFIVAGGMIVIALIYILKFKQKDKEER